MGKLILLLLVFGGGWFGWEYMNHSSITNQLSISSIQEKQYELEQKKENLSQRIQVLQQEIADKIEQGEERVDEIKTSLEQAQRSFVNTKSALEQLKTSVVGNNK